MNDFYETGGVPPAPQSQQPVVRKCPECGHIHVASRLSGCPKCNEEKKDGTT
jgi:rubrerythrin